MKSTILLPAAVCITLLSAAQQQSTNGFAIVSNGAGKMSWLNIQEIDLATGAVNRHIFEMGKTRYVMLNGLTRKKVVNKETALTATTAKTDATGLPTATMVAAAAFDARHNKLFFAPLRVGELRWVNLNEKADNLNVYCLPDAAFAGGDLVNEARNITRMVIASDGNGYALTNDGNHLIRFTTGKKTVITDLGKLNDDPANREISIHKRETSWGGDMVADASGNVFLISSYKAVFKINLQTRMATFSGFIHGLPVEYTTNGAAVDSNGDVILSSAQSAEGYYKLDLATLKAEKQATMGQSVTSSDLASSNYVFQKAGVPAGNLISRAPVLKSYISYFPNPVVQRLFKVRFENNEPGLYNIQLSDMAGKVISEKRVNIIVANQTEDVPVHAGLAKGVYVVKVVNGSNKTLSSGEILLQ